MIYEYLCPKCQRAFDVVKSYRDMDAPETCSCGETAIRQFVPRKVHFIGAKVTHAEYNPGLGCIVRNQSHKKEIMKERGLIEIGNEKPETFHKHYDQSRLEAWEKGWESAEGKGWVGDGECLEVSSSG